MTVDWTKIYKKYKGLWVALEKDKVTVIASGKTAKEVLEKSQQKGKERPILFRVPAKILPLVGSAWV